MNSLTNPRDVLNRLSASGDWYRIVNKGDGSPAELYLYDEIGLWGTTAGDFSDKLADVKASELSVFISSIGGSVFDGIAIYNALRSHSARVVTRVDSLAASIASVIAQAGDRREILTGAQMMIHDASGLAMGDAATMREMADLLDKQTDNIAEIYAERSGRDAADYREAMAAETWLNAAEAVELGLADEVVKPTSKAAAEAGDDETDEAAEGDPVDTWRGFLASVDL